MTLGEKIQRCRKAKNISQEEMASVLGVSRQALSKWECNTSIPEIDKIVAISNYFNVTTDYLLKEEYLEDMQDEIRYVENKQVDVCHLGEKPLEVKQVDNNKTTRPEVTERAEIKGQKDMIALVSATALIAIGLIISLSMANDGTLFFYWKFSSAAWGICIQIIGLSIFEILYFSKNLNRKTQYLFWSINTWLLTMMPTILSAGILVRVLSRITSLVGLFYLIFNGVITLIFLLLSKSCKNRK